MNLPKLAAGTTALKEAPVIHDARSTLRIWRSPWRALPLLATLLCGCTTDAQPEYAGPYERCINEHGGAVNCTDDTECVAPLLGAGFVCRGSCVEDADCLPLEGFEVDCETFTSGRICVVSCAAAAACPGTTTCGSHKRINGEMVNLCF